MVTPLRKPEGSLPPGFHFYSDFSIFDVMGQVSDLNVVNSKEFDEAS